jgi:uncharacterized membrane protein
VTSSLIQSPAGVLAALTGTAGFFFWLERATGWRVFQYVVPMIWIYTTPMLMRNLGVLPEASPVYDAVREYGLPSFIVLLLIGVDVGAAVRVMGKGVGVMLLGTAGVVVGGPVSYYFVHGWLDPEAWKGFGALAGSWIGGTANMAAVAGGLETPPELFGLAVLADNLIYVGWLPLLLVSKQFGDRFNRWTGVSTDRLEKMEAAAALETKEERSPATKDYLYLAVVASSVTWFAGWLAPHLPQIGVILSTSSWNILIVTTVGILLSFTAIKKIPGSHAVAMGIGYLFIARMGATASLEGWSQAPAFVLGAVIWILIHGAFCLAGAWLFKVDVHSAAIASAANIGGVISAPVVAAYHRESLVPVSVLMALLGNTLGTYAAFLAAELTRLAGRL